MTLPINAYEFNNGKTTYQFGGMIAPGLNNIAVADFNDGGKPSGVFGDAALPNEDGTSFGVDTLTGTLFTIDGFINGGAVDGRNTFNTFHGLWNDDINRMNASQLSKLSFNLEGSIPLTIYGRPRNFAATSFSLQGRGAIPYSATFQAADHKYYDYTPTVMTFGLAPPENVASQILNVNPYFESNVLSWTPTGCTMVQSTTHAFEGTHSAKLTPDGITSTVYTTSEHQSVTPGIRYNMGYWAYAATGTVPMVASIDWWNSGGAYISSTVGISTNIAQTFIPVFALGFAPAGSVTATIKLKYNVTTPATSAIMYVDKATFSESPGLQFPLVFPIAMSGISGNSQIISNNGNENTWPVFTIYGPVQNPTIAYVDYGTIISLNTTLAAGQSVVIDTRPWARTVIRNDGASLAGSLSGNRMAQMALIPGPVNARYRGADSTGTSFLSMSFRSAYSTP